MDANVELDSLLERARDAVAAHPRHDLRIGLRQAIYTALDSRPGERTAAGRARRGRLAKLCAEQVRNEWLTARPDDDLPGRVIEQTKRALEHGPSAGHEPSAGEWWAAVDDVAAAGGSCVHAGYAAVAALRTALSDEPFDPQAVDESAVDEVLDPYTFDAAYLAAAAYAGGLPDDPRSDPERRSEFWYWWLLWAVPEVVEDHGG